MHTEASKNLIELATAVNEEYARRDLEEICEQNESLRGSIEDYREKKNSSNLTTIWAIRHHKFVPKKSVSATMEELYEISSDIAPDAVVGIQAEMVEVAKMQDKKKVKNTEISI